MACSILENISGLRLASEITVPMYLKLVTISSFCPFTFISRGWSGGAMVLGKHPVPGRPTTKDYSRARAYCACSGCGWVLFGHFYSYLSFLFSFSLSLGDGPI